MGTDSHRGTQTQTQTEIRDPPRWADAGKQSQEKEILGSQKGEARDHERSFDFILPLSAAGREMARVCDVVEPV